MQVLRRLHLLRRDPPGPAGAPQRPHRGGAPPTPLASSGRRPPPRSFPDGAHARRAQKWYHPSCFAHHGLRCDYAPTDRAKCHFDGTPIGKGAPRLVVDIEGANRLLYKPQNFAPFLSELFEHVRCVSCEDIAARGELLAEHHAWAAAALAGQPVGPTPVGPTSTSAQTAPARQADPLWLDGCEMEIHWPQSHGDGEVGRARLRTGIMYYRPDQARHRERNVYLFVTPRRRGGLRERKTSWRSISQRWHRVLSSPHGIGRRCRWSSAERAAARTRLSSGVGEALESVALSLGRDAAAVEQRLRKPEAAAMEHLEPQAAPSERTTPTTEAECEGEESEASIVD